LGYRRTPATFQLQLMAHASRWLHGEGLGAEELTSEVVERFLAERRAAGYTNYVTALAMAPLLSYLRGLGVVPSASPCVAVGAVEVLLVDYREYLSVERGLTGTRSRATCWRSGRSWTVACATATSSTWLALPRPMLWRSWLSGVRRSRVERRR
jgi:hypothetical protein